MAQELKNRVELPKFFAEQGFTEGAEIGVFTGYFSEIMFKNIPGLHLYCVDIWGEGKYKRAEEECLERLQSYNATIIKKYSVEAAKNIPDGSLDFVYIDGAHDYDNVKADIEAWTPKVRIGGIVSGDDFYDFPSGKGGVMRAATEYTSHHHYNLRLTDWNIDNPIRDDRQPSFWFVKTHNDGMQHPHTNESYDGFKNS
jgi:predicted O-methyltransferase YrrM